ncbi:uroporphyrinogen-III synthase [Lysinibacillus sp. PLM2]|nr:uroporphyrinogen-III synthase [Lysinibacillus sp. PLM2]
MLKQSLHGKTVILTGSSITRSIVNKIQQLGGEVHIFPLIKIFEIIEPYDHMQLEMARNFDWLIFTSQNAVDAFSAKMLRHQLLPSMLKGKIAAVGEKTRDRLVANGLTVDFMPSIYSADHFIEEFPKIIEGNPRCLFVRGSKAKDTIKNGVPFSVDEWIVYDTEDFLEHIQSLVNVIKSKDQPIIIFASPSAVNVFAIHIAPIVGWDSVKLASIGHITAQAIEKRGGHVTYQPNTYTLEAVINEISNEEEKWND